MGILDISQPVTSALASLALAEATLTVVRKDDAWAAAVSDERDKDSKEWMISAPTIPKSRATLFVRFCLAASEHAAKASGLLSRAGSESAAGKVDGDLLKYAEDLRRTARAKAMRYLGIDAEMAGKTGEGIAWLRAGLKELGLAVSEKSGKKSGLQSLKQAWVEKREDRRIVKGSEKWGMDAGRLEEGRVLEWLEAQWVKLNNTVSPACNGYWYLIDGF